MTSLPSVTGKQLITALGRIGFEVVRTRGSHHFLKHADGRATVVLHTPAKLSDEVCCHGFCGTAKSVVRT